MESFRWKVAVSGYRWVTNYTEPVTLAFFKEAVIPVKWEFREYEPKEGLFLEFARTATNRRGILAFAARYGHLGEGDDELRGCLEPTCSDESSDSEKLASIVFKRATVPQEFQGWVAHIKKMRKAVRLWERFRGEPSRAESRQQLQAAVHEQICDMRVGIRFEISGPPRPQAAIRIVPTTLIGAMWLQLAESIAGNKMHRSCVSCGWWFEIGPSTARKSKFYCSEACRSRAYRGRKEEALRLAAQGKEPKEIAGLVGANLASVKQWLKPKVTRGTQDG